MKIVKGNIIDPYKISNVSQDGLLALCFQDLNLNVGDIFEVGDTRLLVIKELTRDEFIARNTIDGKAPKIPDGFSTYFLFTMD